MPNLGATFVPGGFDDYYMPEVVAPSPQRYVCSGSSPVVGQSNKSDRRLRVLLLLPRHYATVGLSSGLSLVSCPPR